MKLGLFPRGTKKSDAMLSPHDDTKELVMSRGDNKPEEATADNQKQQKRQQQDEDEQVVAGKELRDEPTWDVTIHHTTITERDEAVGDDHDGNDPVPESSEEETDKEDPVPEPSAEETSTPQEMALEAAKEDANKEDVALEANEEDTAMPQDITPEDAKDDVKKEDVTLEATEEETTIPQDTLEGAKDDEKKEDVILEATEEETSIPQDTLEGATDTKKEDVTLETTEDKSDSPQDIVPEPSEGDAFKSSYLAYLEANHKGNGKSSGKVKASRGRARASTKTRSARTLSPMKLLSSVRSSAPSIATKPGHSTTVLAPSKPTSEATEGQVSGKSAYLAYLEANNKSKSNGKPPRTPRQRQSSSFGLMKSMKLRRQSALEAKDEAGQTAGESKAVIVDTGAVDLKGDDDDQQSQPPTDDSVIEPEESKDMAMITNCSMETPVLSNVGDDERMMIGDEEDLVVIATENVDVVEETTPEAEPASTEVEKKSETSFFDYLLDCSSMGMCTLFSGGSTSSNIDTLEVTEVDAKVELEPEPVAEGKADVETEPVDDAEAEAKAEPVAEAEVKAEPVTAPEPEEELVQTLQEKCDDEEQSPEEKPQDGNDAEQPAVVVA
jgi:hypothetical protein